MYLGTERSRRLLPNRMDKVRLFNLENFPRKNAKFRTLANVQLEPAEEVKFHIHTGECESYCIISVTGGYNNNGEKSRHCPAW